jgi:hypothetical protein
MLPTRLIGLTNVSPAGPVKNTVSVAPRMGGRFRPQVFRRQVDVHALVDRDHHGGDRHVDVRALAGTVPVVQRRQDRDRGVQSGVDGVRERVGA